MKVIKSLFAVPIFIILFVFFSFHTKAYAATVRTGENVVISQDQAIDDSLFTSGSKITIDGNVKGDVVCAGENIVINGNIDGDVICAGRTITVNGKVNGNIRVAGETIIISGPIARNVMAFAKDIKVGSLVQGEVLFGAQDLDLQGSIAKNLSGGVESANIAGTVGKNVNLQVDNLKLTQSAKIGGDLNYTSQNQATIASQSGISGKINYKSAPKKSNNGRDAKSEWVTGAVFSILSYLVIALLMVLLWPKNVIRVIEVTENSLWRSFGWGIVVMFLTPIIAVILMVTIIGIPAGILLLVVWGITLFLSKVYISILVGKKILKAYWKNKKGSLVWAAIIGVVITGVVFSIPLVGGFLDLIAVFVGLGGIFYSLRPGLNKTSKTKAK